MVKKRLKQGYMYTLDVVIAIIILMIGLLLIAGSYFYTPHKVRAEGITDDITGVLAHTRIYEVCPDYEPPCHCHYPSMQDLCEASPTQVKNPELSLLEFMGQLYHDKRRTAIEAIINDTIIHSKILPANYEMQVILFDPEQPGQLEQLFPLKT